MLIVKFRVYNYKIKQTIEKFKENYKELVKFKNTKDIKNENTENNEAFDSKLM